MSCLKPLLGYSAGTTDSGRVKHRIVNPWRYDDVELAVDTLPIADLLLPCGKCLGCKKRRVREWSMRSFHQEQITPGGLFLTLTYDEEHLPSVSLVPRDWTLFVRAVKRRFPEWDIRYLACGEYGEKFSRPHFHAVLWNLDIQDLKRHGKSSRGHPQFVSETLSGIWSKGLLTVQFYDPSHGGYVAGYIMDTWYPSEVHRGANGRLSNEVFDPVLGAFVELERPFVRQSKRAVGRDWYETFKDDLFKGFVTYSGRQMAVPATYLRWLEKDCPDKVAVIREAVAEFFAKQEYFAGDASVRRLVDRTRFAEAVAKRRGFKGYA